MNRELNVKEDVCGKTIIPGRYRHFKGNEYEVICTAKNSETLEDMVVYRALYGTQEIWVRPAHMWNETVERDGTVYRRFTYVGESNMTDKIEENSK